MKTEYDYVIVSKLSDNFGTLHITVLSGEGVKKSFSFDEGNWPDQLQLHNEVKRAFNFLVGE